MVHHGVIADSTTNRSGLRLRIVSVSRTSVHSSSSHTHTYTRGPMVYLTIPISPIHFYSCNLVTLAIFKLYVNSVVLISLVMVCAAIKQLCGNLKRVNIILSLDEMLYIVKGHLRSV